MLYFFLFCSLKDYELTHSFSANKFKSKGSFELNAVANCDQVFTPFLFINEIKFRLLRRNIIPIFALQK